MQRERLVAVHLLLSPDWKECFDSSSEVVPGVYRVRVLMERMPLSSPIFARYIRVVTKLWRCFAPVVRCSQIVAPSPQPSYLWLGRSFAESYRSVGRPCNQLPSSPLDAMSVMQ